MPTSIDERRRAGSAEEQARADAAADASARRTRPGGAARRRGRASARSCAIADAPPERAFGRRKSAFRNDSRSPLDAAGCVVARHAAASRCFTQLPRIRASTNESPPRKRPPTSSAMRIVPSGV